MESKANDQDLTEYICRDEKRAIKYVKDRFSFVFPKVIKVIDLPVCIKDYPDDFIVKVSLKDEYIEIEILSMDDDNYEVEIMTSRGTTETMTPIPTKDHVLKFKSKQKLSAYEVNHQIIIDTCSVRHCYACLY